MVIDDRLLCKNELSGRSNTQAVPLYAMFYFQFSQRAKQLLAGHAPNPLPHNRLIKFTWIAVEVGPCG